MAQYFNWQQVAMLASNDAYGTGVASAFVTNATNIGLKVATVAYFGTTDTDFTSPLASVKSSGARIIILAAVAGAGGRAVMKQAVLSNMIGSSSGYTWIIAEGSASLSALIGAYNDSSSVTNAQLQEALYGNLATKPRGGFGPVWDQIADIWVNGSLNATLYPGAGNINALADAYVPYSIDSVYAVAFAYWNLAQQGLSFTGAHLKTALQQLSFEGVTGTVEFDKNQDRQAPYQIMNIQRTSAVFEPVGTWSTVSGSTNISVTNAAIIWPDGTNNVPGDGLPHTFYWIEWNSPVSIVFIVLAGIAIICMGLSGLLLAKYEHTPVMRLASPWFLGITLFGLAMMFGTIIATMGQPTEASCTVRDWLGFVGFVVAMSSIVAKTYRVDVIFRKRRRIKKVSITNVELIKYVVGIIAPIIILMIVWTILDRPQPSYSNDFTNLRINVVCRSKSIGWIVGAFIYCAVLLLLGLVLSFRTRSVPDGFNETWYVYISGYITVLFGVLGVVLGFLNMSSPLGLTIILSICLLCGGLGMWGLIYWPKFYICLFAPKKNTAELKTSRGMSQASIGRPDQLTRTWHSDGVGNTSRAHTGPSDDIETNTNSKDDSKTDTNKDSVVEKTGSKTEKEHSKEAPAASPSSPEKPKRKKKKAKKAATSDAPAAKADAESAAEAAEDDE